MTHVSAPWLRDAGAQAVCAALVGAGQQAWFVGGCVRNALMGRPTSDIDVTTDAPPDLVTKVMESQGFRVEPTGIDHGTVTVIAHGTSVEVTTFRRDVETDGRRATVAFATTIGEDARRRDFTMNALYAAPDGTLADPLGGLPDLLARRVRFIGDAEIRIREDFLRILRFFRFTALYGDPDLGIDAEGLAACAAQVEGIALLARERIGWEMFNLLAAPDPAPALAAMAACGALAAVLPGADAPSVARLVHAEGEAGLAPDPVRRLAALGGSDIGHNLRLKKTDAARLDRLRSATLSEAGPAELGYRLGADESRDVLALRAAALALPFDPDAADSAAFGATRTFPVSAADLMPALQGPALGQRLRDLESAWIASGFALDRAALLV